MNAVEVGGIALHFHQRLTATVRAAVEVGVRGRSLVERRGQRLGGDGGDVRAAIAVVDLLGAALPPVGIARQVAGVGRGRRVAPREPLAERADGAAQSADALEVELAVPVGRQAEAEVDGVPRRRGVPIHLAVGRLGRARRHEFGRRDRGARRRDPLQRRHLARRRWGHRLRRLGLGRRQSRQHPHHRHARSSHRVQPFQERTASAGAPACARRSEPITRSRDRSTDLEINRCTHPITRS